MRKEKVSWLILVITLIAYAITQGMNIGFSESTPSISVEPPSSSALIGETFNVDITLTNVINLYGWNVLIRFNSTILNATSLIRGHFLEKPPPVWTMWQLQEMAGQPYGVINNTIGYIIIGDTFMPPYPPSGVTGNGTLLSISFLVKAEGATSLSFDEEQTKLTTIIGTTKVAIEHERVDGFFNNMPVVEVGWINGVVTDFDTGLPLEGATVSADGVSNFTDASGFYSIEVSPGTYLLR